MLTVQSSAEFSSIQIGKRKRQCSNREFKQFLGARREVALFRWIDGAANDFVGFDLYYTPSIARSGVC
jgi:hypothetical protein